MEQPSIVIVMAAYNEQSTILDQIKELSEIADVVVVNDGSSDDTQSICEAAPCSLINLNKNYGYDFALEQAIRAGRKYDYIITTDADGEIPIECVREVKEALLEGASFVVGVRDIIPRFAEKIINKFIFLRFGISDIFCGLKGYKTSDICYPISMSGSIGTSIVLDMLRAGKNFSTVNVEIKLRCGESRFGKNNITTNFKILRVIKHVI